MNAGTVDESLDLLVAILILLTKMRGQSDQQLSSDDFIAVHVRHVFEFRFEWLVNLRVIREDDHSQRTTLDGFHGQIVEDGDVRTLRMDGVQRREQLVGVVVSAVVDDRIARLMLRRAHGQSQCVDEEVEKVDRGRRHGRKECARVFAGRICDPQE